MPNIKMLQAHREMIEKEKLVHQGKVKARRSQETDTKDVADKTNKSEIARTIKKGEQDKRSAKNELDLAVKKEANASQQKMVGAIGAVVGMALGYANGVVQKDAAETKAKKAEAGKLGKQNEGLKAQNKGLEAENKAIKDKGPVSPKDQEKIKANEGTITANKAEIGKIQGEIGKIQGDLKEGAGKGLLGRVADSLSKDVKDMGTAIKDAPTNISDKISSSIESIKSKVDSMFSGGGQSSGNTPKAGEAPGAPATTNEQTPGVAPTNNNPKTTENNQTTTPSSAKPEQASPPDKSKDSSEKPTQSGGTNTNETTKNQSNSSTPPKTGVEGIKESVHNAGLSVLSLAKSTDSSIESGAKGLGKSIGNAISSMFSKKSNENDDKKSTSAPPKEGGVVTSEGSTKVETSKNTPEETSKFQKGISLFSNNGDVKKAAESNNAREIDIAGKGMNSAQESSNSTRDNLDLLNKASDPKSLSEGEVKTLKGLGVTFDSSGKPNGDSIQNAKNSQGIMLAGSEKQYREFAQMKNYFENTPNASGAAYFATEKGNSSMQKALSTEGKSNLFAKGMSLIKPSGDKELIESLKSLSGEDKKRIGIDTKDGMESIEKTVAGAGEKGGANAAKYAGLSQNIKDLIGNGTLGFNKDTGAITATTGGLMGVGGNTDKIMGTFSSKDEKGNVTFNTEKAKETIGAILEADPAAAGKILSDIRQKDPVAFAAITAGMTEEQIGKAIGGAIDSRAISVSEAKDMLTTINGDKDVTGDLKTNPINEKTQKIIDQIADSNVNAADKLFDAGVNVSQDTFAKIGGSKVGGENVQTPSAFNTALLMLNLAGPAIQMYLQAVDKIREAQEQQLEAMKKYAAAKKMVDTLRGDLKRLEGDGQSGGGGMQGAQAGTGGAR